MNRIADAIGYEVVNNPGNTVEGTHWQLRRPAEPTNGNIILQPAAQQRRIDMIDIANQTYQNHDDTSLRTAESLPRLAEQLASNGADTVATAYHARRLSNGARLALDYVALHSGYIREYNSDQGIWVLNRGLPRETTQQGIAAINLPTLTLVNSDGTTTMGLGESDVIETNLQRGGDTIATSLTTGSPREAIQAAQPMLL